MSQTSAKKSAATSHLSSITDMIIVSWASLHPSKNLTHDPKLLQKVLDSDPESADRLENLSGLPLGHWPLSAPPQNFVNIRLSFAEIH